MPRSVGRPTGVPRPGRNHLSGPRHLILVGLPGSGKSTVAPVVADALGTGHRDIDRWIEVDAARAIAELFATEGEAAFRARERAAMAAALAEPPMVISPGGGWAAEPGNLAAAEPHALTIYLYVSPEVAAERLGAAADRPLLRDGPLPRLRELLARRERWYRLAGIEIDAQPAPEAVAAGVVAAARRYGGW